LVLPLATKAHVGDGMLDLVCFEASRRAELSKWLNSPYDEPAPVTLRKGKVVELTWEDVANRLDDESHSNRESKQAAEISCEKEQLHVLIPVKHPAQKTATNE
jgi:diacylglycerol kinase family enzyme